MPIHEPIRRARLYVCPVGVSPDCKPVSSELSNPECAGCGEYLVLAR